MADKPKRKMSENSLKNLKPFSERTQAERRELAKKGAERTNQIKREKIKRAESKEIIFDEFLGTKEQLRELWLSLSPKDRKDILLKLLPNDDQNLNLNGSLGTKTVFVTAEEHQQTLKHIQDVINEQ